MGASLEHEKTPAAGAATACFLGCLCGLSTQSFQKGASAWGQLDFLSGSLRLPRRASPEREPDRSCTAFYDLAWEIFCYFCNCLLVVNQEIQLILKGGQELGSAFSCFKSSTSVKTTPHLRLLSGPDQHIGRTLPSPSLSIHLPPTVGHTPSHLSTTWEVTQALANGFMLMNNTKR